MKFCYVKQRQKYHRGFVAYGAVFCGCWSKISGIKDSPSSRLLRYYSQNCSSSRLVLFEYLMIVFYLIDCTQPKSGSFAKFLFISLYICVWETTEPWTKGQWTWLEENCRRLSYFCNHPSFTGTA